jgi:hypothetical protein
VLPQQVAQLEIDLNLDPLEVIINPINPPPNDFLEINDLIEEIEQVIPQQPVQDQQQIQALEPEVHVQLQANEENGPFMNGLPYPTCLTLLGKKCL